MYMCLILYVRQSQKPWLIPNEEGQIVTHGCDSNLGTFLQRKTGPPLFSPLRLLARSDIVPAFQLCVHAAKGKAYTAYGKQYSYTIYTGDYYGDILHGGITVTCM